MTSKVKSAAKAPAKAESAKKQTAKAEKPATKKTAASSVAAKTPKTAKTTAKSAGKPAAKLVKAEPEAKRELKAPAKPKDEKAAKRKQPAARVRKKAEPDESVRRFKAGDTVLDPIGDTTDGEGRTYPGEFEGEPAAAEEAAQSSAEVAAFRKETRIEASDAILAGGPGMEATQEAMEAIARNQAVETAGNEKSLAELSRVRESGPGAPTGQPDPEKLERLQKILSQAGIASRRRAEEMITEGRVMVNGQVVTTLGSKADPERDHIRVDGKLLHGAERHRYFLLNKPRGFVTTVSDPEGRPTVMKFFEKMHERLYPVGRLDYQSEGLLLMTNDGELANLLTKAGSGVEKTYLVKVAGRPTEEELEKLRGGVTIERAEAGSERVRTAPARVRQVRVGDNPWFEVVLIEGRNRELRKMFSAVGHFVEKIRRVGYGPLALDVEPGKMRELTPDEVTALRLTAEGKMKPKRLHADRMLPKDAGMAAEKRNSRADRGRSRKANFRNQVSETRPGAPGREFARREGGEFGNRGGGFRKSQGGGFRKSERGGFAKRERRDFPRREDAGSEKREQRGFGAREGGGFKRREGGGFAGRDRTSPPRGEQGQKREFRPRAGGFGSRPRGEGANRGGEPRGFGGRSEERSFGKERPQFKRPGFGGGPRRDQEGGGFDGKRKPFGGRGERDFGGGERKPFGGGAERRFGQGGGKPFREGGERKLDGERKPFRPQGYRPYFKRGPRPEGRGNDVERGENRGPRPGAQEFRGGGRKFGGGKPRFGGKPGGFGGPRREGGRGGRPGGGRGFGGKKRG
jgi:23S rRNA pseudouridine2605 synthase